MGTTDSPGVTGASWRDEIDDRLVAAAAQQPTDVAGHRARDVPATFAPRDVADVRHIVCGATEAGLPLYTVSTGRNWGLGSRLPAVDGCAVLDLAGLDRIRRLDTERGFAVIEPGVTQRQLAAATAGTPWLVNLTAACADTSVVGNCLERGDGVLRPRASEILGVEAVLADGSVVTTGGLVPDGRYLGPACGPDLTSAFVQSNLGIVTAMAVALVPRPEAIRLLYTRVAPGRAAEAVQALRLCFVSGICTATSRVFNIQITPRPAAASDDECDAIMPLLGPTAIVDAAADLACRALDRVSQPGTTSCFDHGTTTPDNPLFPAVRLVGGEPTCAFTRELFGVDCADVDSGTTGWMVFVPLIPLDSNGPQRALDLIQRAVDEHGAPVRVEIIVASQHTAGAVVEIPFAATAEGRATAVEAGHALRETLRTTFLAAGMPARRSNVDDAARELADRDDPGYRWHSALKSFLDPRNILAPGRYLG
jgi:4-cresol dehydrogenase (hydroxylating)